MIKRLCIILFLLILSLFPHSVFAQENFTTGYDITYTVSPNGITHGEFKVDITNKTGQFSSSSYKVLLGFKLISNIKVYDQTQVFESIIDQDENGNTITVFFKDKVAGKNAIRTFNLSFDTQEIAKKRGDVWEVNIPGLSKETTHDKFNIHLIIPESFGRPLFIKPTPVKISPKINSYDFTKEQLNGRSGVSLTFGNHQIYEFTLRYHLKNGNLFPIRTEIALPPDTNYQELLFDSIISKPESVYKDTDGNYLARYYLFPSEKKEIIVKGRVKITLAPKKENLTKEQEKEYTKEQIYWKTSDSKIQELAKKLKTPQAIYEYVVKTLNYDFSRATAGKERLGAIDVLQNPNSAACLEFTDLFITLSRAAGIPAREIDGFAYTDNSKERPLSLLKDVLHSWPEYYDAQQKTWIMVDPTWENTTGGINYFSLFDLDHIAFVIKGQESTYPIPAGGYKLTQELGLRDIFITPSIKEWNPKPSFDLLVNTPNVAIAGLPVVSSITIKNTSGAAISNKTLHIASPILFPNDQQVTLNDIPPYGISSIQFSFYPVSFLTNTDTRATISLYDKSISQNIKIRPFYMLRWIIVGGVIFGIFSIGLFIIASRTWNLPVSRKK